MIWRFLFSSIALPNWSFPSWDTITSEMKRIKDLFFQKIEEFGNFIQSTREKNNVIELNMILKDGSPKNQEHINPPGTPAKTERIRDGLSRHIINPFRSNPSPSLQELMDKEKLPKPLQREIFEAMGKLHLKENGSLKKIALAALRKHPANHEFQHNSYEEMFNSYHKVVKDQKCSDNLIYFFAIVYSAFKRDSRLKKNLPPVLSISNLDTLAKEWKETGSINGIGTGRYHTFKTVYEKFKDNLKLQPLNELKNLDYLTTAWDDLPKYRNQTEHQRFNSFIFAHRLFLEPIPSPQDISQAT